MTTEGSLSSPITREGRPELYSTRLAASGEFEAVRVNPDGSMASVWPGHTSFPAAVLPSGDSLLVYEPMKGGGLSYRIIAGNGRDQGTPFLKPGEVLTDFTHNWGQVLYRAQEGTAWDLFLLDRSTGVSRRLTNDAVDERSARIPNDMKTVFYEQQRDVRRIAIADLSKVLTAKTAAR